MEMGEKCLDFTHILSENSQLRADTTKLTRTPGRTKKIHLELVKEAKLAIVIR